MLNRIYRAQCLDHPKQLRLFSRVRGLVFRNVVTDAWTNCPWANTGMLLRSGPGALLRDCCAETNGRTCRMDLTSGLWRGLWELCDRGASGVVWKFRIKVWGLIQYFGKDVSAVQDNHTVSA